MENLVGLPLDRGAVLAIGGEMAFTLAKRLQYFIGRIRPRLRVVIRSADRAHDPKALNFVIPSYNAQINRWLDRSQVRGVIDAVGSDRFQYTDAVSGDRSTIDLPAMPRNVETLLSELGY